MTAQEEPIGIVGCGIAGVAFALGLAKLGKHSIIFEKDASFDTRNQGYGLTLQQGGKSLKILGLEQQVNQVSCSSSSHCIFNQDGKLVFAWGPSTSCKENIWKSGRNCHIPRQELRKLLFNQLDNEYTKVIWNADITAIHPKSTHIDIQMNGEKLQVKALVGCDGIHSQVRKFIFKDTKDDLNYLNVIVILGIVDSPLLLNDRVIQMSDGNMRIFAMPFNQKQCMWQCSVPMELEEASRLSRNGASSLKQFMMDSIKTWAHPVIEMITNTPLELITGYVII